MLTMIHSMSKEDLVVLAAAAGDSNIVRQCLRQYPDQVRLKENVARSNGNNSSNVTELGTSYFLFVHCYLLT